jgi:alkylation response protein AidB-like acyl-CoA dehydrogenase
MSDFFADNADLRWYFDHGIDWESLFEHTSMLDGAEPEFTTWEEARDFWRDIVGLVGQFSAEEIAPYQAEIDTQEITIVDGTVVMSPRLETIFGKIKQLELHGMCLPRQLGGMNCPLLLYFLSAELLARGDVSVMTHHSFHGGMAMAMLTYSMQEGSTEFDVASRTLVSTRFQREISEIVAGDAWGCMDITEPDAGSDMGALRTRGVQAEDGTWTVTGQKIFVTSGHGKYHFVIARTEDSEGDDPMVGLHGLSLFLVNTYDEVDGERTWYATMERLEEKLGHHGSPTVSVSFDGAPAQLVGTRGEGFRQMLLLMNNARIGVGFEAVGLCESAYRMARAYAAQRPSMGKMIDKHEIIADYLREMENDILGLRALAVRAAFNEELSHRIRMQRDLLTEEGSEEWKALDVEAKKRTWRSRLTTPLLKFLAAEKAVEIARRALQIHGGVGYTREYGAEKLLRDALVLPIYEGTSQIQALMATKDTLLFITKNPGAFFAAWADAKRRAVAAGDASERGVARLRAAAQAAQVALMQRILRGKLQGRSIGAWKAALADWDTRTDFAPALLHAERLTRMLADAAIADALWSQVKKDPSRRWILDRHLERALPRARYLLDCIKTTGSALLEELADDTDAEEDAA